MTDLNAAHVRGLLDAAQEAPGLKRAADLIANLPTGRTEDVMEGHEQAYRAVEAQLAAQDAQAEIAELKLQNLSGWTTVETFRKANRTNLDTIVKLKAALEPFAVAGDNAIITGSPPGFFVDASAFLAARAALEKVK